MSYNVTHLFKVDAHRKHGICERPSKLPTSSSQPTLALLPHLWRSGPEKRATTLGPREAMKLRKWIGWRQTRHFSHLDLGLVVNQQWILIPGIKNHQTTKLPDMLSVDLRIKQDWMGVFQLAKWGWLSSSREGDRGCEPSGFDGW